MPEEAITRLTPAHLRVYAALALYADVSGVCWPSQSSLASLLRLNVRTLQRHIDEVEASGLVEKVSRKGTSNAYRLVGETGGTAVSTVGGECRGSEHHPWQSVPWGYGSECRGGTAVSAVLTDQEQTKNTPVGEIRPESATKPKAQKRAYSTLSDVLTETHASTRRSYGEHWEATYNPPLDGENFRPTVADALEDAWNHVARKKAADPRLYLGGWLRREAQRVKPGYDREQRYAPQNDGGDWAADAARGLAEVGHD